MVGSLSDVCAAFASASGRGRRFVRVGPSGCTQRSLIRVSLWRGNGWSRRSGVSVGLVSTGLRLVVKDFGPTRRVEARGRHRCAVLLRKEEFGGGDVLQPDSNRWADSNPV